MEIKMRKRRSLSISKRLDSDITKEGFDRLLEILIKNQSVKRNKVGNRECLSLPKSLKTMMKK